MSINVMLDLETFGVAKTSVIIQLAAVQFDNDFNIHSVFNEVISPESCQGYGLTFDLDTVMWWMRQSESAKGSVLMQKNRSDLKDVLQRFKFWMPKGSKPWGNGASFDCSILDNAYRVVGIEKPWKHWDERCYRTINSLLPKDDPNRPPREGIHHNALDDCRYQISQLKYVCNKLGIKLT